jgi:hypothetical protein
VHVVDVDVSLSSTMTKASSSYPSSLLLPWQILMLASYLYVTAVYENKQGQKIGVSRSNDLHKALGNTI